MYNVRKDENGNILVNEIVIIYKALGTHNKNKYPTLGGGFLYTFSDAREYAIQLYKLTFENE